MERGVCRKWLNEGGCSVRACTYIHELNQTQIERAENNMWIERQREEWAYQRDINVCEEWAYNYREKCDGKENGNCRRYHPKLCTEDKETEGCKKENCEEFHVRRYKRRMEDLKMCPEITRMRKEICEDWLIRGQCKYPKTCKWDHSLTEEQLRRLRNWGEEDRGNEENVNEEMSLFKDFLEFRKRNK